MKTQKTLAQRLQAAFKKTGLEDGDIESIIKKPIVRQRIASLVKNNGLILPHEDPEEVAKTATIMGANFIGPREVCLTYNIQPTPRELAALERVPFSADLLGGVKETHVLVADIGRPLQQLLDGAGKRYRAKLQIEYGKNARTPTWILMRKEVLPDSLGKLPEAQRKLIPTGEEQMGYEILFYVLLTVYLVKGFRLLPLSLSRTVPAGEQVCVGLFNRLGIQTKSVWVGSKRKDLGMVTQVKI